MILIDNPGSSSRKYGLYMGATQRASLHFEHDQDRFMCSVTVGDSNREFPVGITTLSESTNHILPMLKEAGVLQEGEKISYIGMRIVAPSDFFLKDHLVDDNVIKKLEELQPRAPLHIKATLEEIRLMQQNFPDVKLIWYF